MVAMQSSQVAKLVQDRLNHAGDHASRVRVLADEVRPGTEESEWWYVPVSFHQDPHSMYMYYEVFAKVEEELEEHDHVNVLLVPRIVYHPEHS